MTDDLWTALIAMIDPLRGEIGADPDGSVWQALCERLSTILAQHGWPPLDDVHGTAWDWVASGHDGEMLSLMTGLNDKLFLALESGTEIIRERTWYL